jgi:subtilisin family serine protease
VSRALFIALASVLVGASSASAQLPARWPRAPLTDVARALVGADVAVERYGLRGRGATLCLVDTGVDGTHPDLTIDGTSRARWVWDAFAEPRGEHPELEARFGGAVVDALGAPGDRHGHGTAMAAIALGRAGLAPDAHLVVARAYDTLRGGFPDDAVVRAVGFCRAIAELDEELDPRRMVVLLSLGGHDGSHDGRGAFERALEAHAAFVPIVVAAGNDGRRAVRATGRLFAGERGLVEIQVPRSDREDAALAITLRTDGRATIESPEGGARVDVTQPSAWLLPGAMIAVEPVEGDAGALRVRIEANDGPLASGTYRLHIEGPAQFETWLAGARLGSTFFAPSLGGPHARVDETITIPATAPRLVSVAAIVARSEVETAFGTITTPGMAGERADYSSLGPSPSGAPEPDLAAPGGWVVTALSRDVRDGDAENLVGGSLARYRTSDARIAVRGTSVAAAVVAGAVLLAMELGPREHDDVRALLVASARGQGWAPDVGAGVLDVPRLLALWLGEPIDAASTITATRPFVPSDAFLWLSARGPGSRLRVELDGNAHELALRHGTAQLTLPIDRAQLGVPLVVRASIDGTPLAPIEVPVVLERGPRGAVGLGGGCSVARGPASIAWSLVWAAALVLRIRRRTR